MTTFLVFAVLISSGLQPTPVQAQNPLLSVEVSAGWSAPHSWQRTFGQSGPAFDLAIARNVTAHVAVRTMFGLEAYRQVAVPEPPFFCDPIACDPESSLPDGVRGVNIWHATAGVAFNLLSHHTRWQFTPTAALGVARVVPHGRVAYVSPNETRPMIVTGIQIGHRASRTLEFMLGVQGRGIIELDLTGLPRPPVPIQPQNPQSTRASTVWSFPVTVGTRIRSW